ncbi:FIG00484315: hypothetical protein [hydrothermal vent metagenome]|uniref:Uncharacterized protein n=1 Tax=hydrothermal vent metagenome TaxID=652676 RepID=A0A160TKV0_9ZZZZ
MGVEPDKINASVRALSDAAYANGMITNGLGTITTDELHAYEEGLNSDAERLYLNWGEPRAVERLIATARALSGVVQKNPVGHLHFASNWYGGKKMYREGPWEWQKPYSFTVMHAPILIGLYNGNPAARGLVTGTIDGWMAHGRQDKDGNWAYPNEINWRTDAERAGDGGGVSTPLQSAWAAWRFTGDEKYLRPVLGRTVKGGPASLADINENAVDALGRQKDWGAALTAKATGGGAYERYAAWNATGDTKWLDALHADAIADKTQHQYMYTEGHWWSDRVDQPNEILQRERLGGIALRRNQTWPGNSVSWRFAEAGAAERVAILVPGAAMDKFKVIAWNTSGRPQKADMTAWNVTAGRWKMTGPVGASEIALERSASLPLVFAPGENVFEFALVAPGLPTERRADLGIGIDDIAVTKRVVTVTVHSLGAIDAPGGTLSLEDGAGRVLATALVPPLAAPLDLQPKTAKVKLIMPAGAARVRIALAGNAPETTLLNNVVALPAK